VVGVSESVLCHTLAWTHPPKKIDNKIKITILLILPPESPSMASIIHRLESLRGVIYRVFPFIPS